MNAWSAVAAIVACLSLAYCTVQQRARDNERELWCWEHRGYISGWTGDCVLPPGAKP